MSIQTTGSAGLSAEMKTYYDRRLIARALPRLLHNKFAQRRLIPKRNGKIVEFRKFSTLGVKTDSLTEGIPPALQSLEVTTVTATVEQKGAAIGFSDVVATVAIDPILEETTDLLAEQAAESLDEIYREVLVAGTSVQYASTAAGRVNVTAAMILSVAEIREAVLTLTLNRAQKIDGFYHAIIHPRTAHDIQGTTEWVTANNEHRSGRVFDGSLGTLYGVKFWVTDKAKVFTGAGAAGADVYASLFFGANAFGIVDLAGHNLQTIHKPLGSAGTADPLNQQQTMGWKCMVGTKIISQEYMLRVEHGVST